MKLTRTEPITGGAPTAAISSAPIKTAQMEDDEEEEIDEGALNGMSIVALVGSIAALFVALLGWTKVTPFTQPEIKKAEEAAWVSSPKSDWKLPAQYNPFAKEGVDGSFVNKYNEIKKDLHALPIRPEATK